MVGSKLKKGNGFSDGVGQGDRDRAYAEPRIGQYREIFREAEER